MMMLIDELITEGGGILIFFPSSRAIIRQNSVIHKVDARFGAKLCQLTPKFRFHTT